MTLYVALTGVWELPATSVAPAQVAVKRPTMPLPPVTDTAAVVPTPLVASVVRQAAVGAAPTRYTAPFVTFVTDTAGAVASRRIVTGSAVLVPTMLLAEQRELNVPSLV